MDKLGEIAIVVVVAVVVIVAVTKDKDSTPSAQGNSYLAASLTPEQTARRDEKLRRPDLENQFVRVVTSAQASYNNAPDDFAKGATRPARKQSICLLALSRNSAVLDWVGQVSKRTTNGDGKGVLSVALASDVTLQTWNNSLSDFADHTLIEPGSSVFNAMGTLQDGDYVRVSGRFSRSDTDCLKEGSLTLSGSMKSPDFIFRFDKIVKIDIL